MFLLFLVHLLYSTHQIFDHSFKQNYFLEEVETKCFYDTIYTKSYISKTMVCFIRCTFNSINSITNGGAILIDLENFGINNIILNCTFSLCSAKSGGAFYFYYKPSKNCTIEFLNTIFDKNSAYSSSGGSLYINTHPTSCNLTIKNCTFKSNTAINNGGSIFIRNTINSIKNCSFINSLITEKDTEIKGGAIYCEDGKSYDGISDCIFTNNTAICENELSNGGAISIRNAIDTSYKFDNCIFTNNSAISFGHESFGGAISFSYEYGIYSLKDCTFVNNTSHSSNSQAFGGAVSFNKSKNSINISLNCCHFYNNSANSLNESSHGGAICSFSFLTFMIDCEFINNTANSKELSEGGAFYAKVTSIYVSSFNFFRKCIFNNLSFSRNFAYSNSFSNGGAIYYKKTNLKDSLSYWIEYFSNCSFSFNKAFSNHTSKGGAIDISNDVDGNFVNCSFKNNIAEVILNEKSTKSDCLCFGGAFHHKKASIKFRNCTFINNSCFGNATRHYIHAQAGALYSSYKRATINQSIFINNSLRCSGIYSYAKGGSCIFIEVSGNLIDCRFMNNEVISLASNSFTGIHNAYGGAVYISNCEVLFCCKNCTFTNNTASVPSNRKKEFAGALYISLGEVNNCTFNENVAYNGCDIMFDQEKKSKLTINNCFYYHQTNANRSINSILFFHTSKDFTVPVVFKNNKFFDDAEIHLFDAERVNYNDRLRFNIESNCITPFDEALYKTKDMSIVNINYNALVPFYAAFDSACQEYIIPPKKHPTEEVSEQIIITQALPISSHSEKMITETPTGTKANVDDRQNDSKNEIIEKMYNKIFVLVIALSISQIAIFISLLVFVILIIKRVNQHEFGEPQEFTFS